MDMTCIAQPISQPKKLDVPNASGVCSVHPMHWLFVDSRQPDAGCASKANSQRRYVGEGRGGER